MGGQLNLLTSQAGQTVFQLRLPAAEPLSAESAQEPPLR